MIKEDRKLDLSERLLRYSAAASLAASGAIAVAAPQARADGTSRTLNCVMDADQEFCDIDFDNDGHAEFELVLSTYTSSLYMYLFSNNSGDQGVSFVYSGSPFYAAVLPYGSSVSVGRGDWTNAFPLLYSASAGMGHWSAPKGHATDPTRGAYLGVKFDLDYGNIHYGWIELYIPSNGDVTVKRIGYDTTAGASIPTAVKVNGLQATGVLRAAGAAAFAALAGVFAWLRRKVARE